MFVREWLSVSGESGPGVSAAAMHFSLLWSGCCKRYITHGHHTAVRHTNTQTHIPVHKSQKGNICNRCLTQGFPRRTPLPSTRSAASMVSTHIMREIFIGKWMPSQSSTVLHLYSFLSVVCRLLSHSPKEE